jgi:hypothetical protein
MYSLSIHFGPSPVPTQFFFKDENKAVIAYDLAGTESDFEIEDDFGQRGKFSRLDFHGAVIENLELGEEARIQRALLHARGQAKANIRGKDDPIIRQGMAMQRGPSMLAPFANGGFNG